MEGGGWGGGAAGWLLLALGEVGWSPLVRDAVVLAAFGAFQARHTLH